MRQRQWLCNTCIDGQSGLFGFGIGLDLPPAAPPGGNNMRGRKICVQTFEVMGDGAAGGDFRRCPSEDFSLPSGAAWAEQSDPHNTHGLCTALRKRYWALGPLLNASIYMSGDSIDSSKCLSLVKRGIFETCLIHSYADWAEAPRIEAEVDTWLEDCEAHAKKVVNDSNWTAAFDLATWVLIALSCILVVLASSCAWVRNRRHGARFKYSFSPESLINSLQLVTRGDGVASTKLELAACVVGLLLSLHYDMYMTGSIVAPSPTREYNSLTEFLEAGYKYWVWNPLNRSASYAMDELEGEFKDIFNRAKSGGWNKNSFIFDPDLDSYYGDRHTFFTATEKIGRAHV